MAEDADGKLTKTADQPHEDGGRFRVGGTTIRSLAMVAVGAMLAAVGFVTLGSAGPWSSAPGSGQATAPEHREEHTANPGAGPLSFHFRPKVDHGRAEVLLQMNLLFLAPPGREGDFQARFAEDWDRAKALCLRILRQAHVKDFDSAERELLLFTDIVDQLNRSLFPEEMRPGQIGPITQPEVLALFVR